MCVYVCVHVFLLILSKLTKENKVNFYNKVFEIWSFKNLYSKRCYIQSRR